MFIKNKKQQKASKIVYLTLSLLFSASQQTYAEVKEDDQEARGSIAPPLRINVDLKNAIIDGPFDSESDTQLALSQSTKHAFERDPYVIVPGWKNHANHVTSIIHKGDPEAKLKVINVRHTPLEQAIDEAITSKASFINLSLSLRDGGISEDLRKAFYRARDKGLGIIMAAGNDSEEIGSTAYTRSLASLVKGMKGSMVLVAATSGAEGQEKLASFSNKAGRASKYTVSAPGTDIQAYGAFNRRVTMSGTSMAAPVVTAAASSLKKAYPALSAREVLTVILDSARKTTVDKKVRFAKKKYGKGVLDLSAAYKRAQEINARKALSAQ